MPPEGLDLMLEEVFKKVEEFDGKNDKKYRELLDDFGELNTELFVLLRKNDEKRLRHRLRTLEKIFVLKRGKALAEKLG